MKNAFARPLVDFWSELNDEVHPEDEPFRAAAPNEINFDFPPPAFVGDLASASVIILMANGGFHPTDIPKEFASVDAAMLWRDALRRPRPADLRWTSPYYLRGELGKRLSDGRAAVVNALAYRSVGVTRDVRRFAETLPSSRFHRDWLHGPLSAAAAAGEVLVVIHRSGLWRPSIAIRSTPNVRVLTGAEPARRYLSANVFEWASASPDQP